MDIFLSPVSHNPMVKKGLFKHEWYNKGISVVGDLINFETGKVKSKTEIERTYSFQIKNFLDYFEVRDVINKFLHVSGQENKTPEKPSIPNHLSFLLRQEQGCKNIYNILNNTNCENKYRNHWNHDLNILIDEVTWRRVFYLCFNTILDNKIIWFRYKLLYHILGTNKLYQIGRSKDNVCRICKSDTETLVHLFVTCETVRQLWTYLNNWVGLSLNKGFSQAPLDILLGYVMTDNLFLPTNTLILATKYYIFTCAVKQNVPVFNILRMKLMRRYQEQLSLSYERGKAEDFKRNWLGFSSIDNRLLLGHDGSMITFIIVA